MQLSFSAIADCIVLIIVANGAPVVLKRLLADRYSMPIDGGLVLRDGHRLLGSDKTWRGLAIGVVAPAFLAPSLGLSWGAGAFVGVAAMAGDCLSSFAKRRIGLAASSMALGLDQIPESLLPAISMRAYISLGAIDIVAIVLVFLVGELALSQVFFRLGVRDRPY